MKPRVEGHLDALVARYPALLPLREEIGSAFLLLYQTVSAGGKLLLCGNGGSAADSDHWAGELLKGFALPRIVSHSGQGGLSEPLARKLQEGIPAIPLTAFPALISAFGNDVDYEYAFAQLVWALGKAGDTLVAISTSGNAHNVRHAAEAARAKQMSVLGLTGETGGELLALCTRCLRMPSRITPHVQEFHLPVYHTLSLMLEEALFGGD